MTHTTERFTTVAVTLLLAAGLIAAGPAFVAGQESLPAAYSGSVTINGDPAPTGVTVIAKVDGAQYGSITVTSEGQYGSPGDNEYLTVQGDDVDTGDEVTFFVNGDSFSETQVNTDPSSITWESGDVATVDLSVSGIDLGDDGDGGDGGGGGGGGGDSAPAPQPDVEGDATAESSFDGRTLSTQVETASAGSSVTSSLNDNTVDDNLQNTGASLNSLRTTFANDVTDASIDTTYSATNPSDTVPDLSSQTNADEVAYVNVDNNVAEDDIDSVTFEFSVSRDRLSSAGLSPDEVSLYRYNGDEYTELDTSVGSEGDDRVTYTAESPGLSVFAIGESSEQVTDTATPVPDTATPVPDTATPAPDTATPEPDVESPVPDDDGGLSPILIGGVVIVVLAIAVGAYLAFGRE